MSEREGEGGEGERGEGERWGGVLPVGEVMQTDLNITESYKVKVIRQIGLIWRSNDDQE